MSAIDSLIPLIYHERQQEGSMLCAQHALNSLLQGQYFSAPDLSEIARRLDEAEHGYLEDRPSGGSTNMDDTGFFSVQVLEEALKVWNLSLIRWRSEAMRPYQDHPHTQMGFILNQSQHWYALRRFGDVSPDPSPDADPGNGHWFNLNSFLPAPERISKLYLGMFLQQAETEGYSVFAVLQRDPEGPLALPRTEADHLAASIPESAAGHYSSSRAPGAPSISASTNPLHGVEGFEDEDMELQAALQASLAGGAFDPDAFASYSAAVRHGAQYSSAPQSATVAPPRREYHVIDDDDEDDGDYVPVPPPAAAVAEEEPADPVAASMARQRAVMERMRRAQEVALQEQYEDEVARFNAGAGSRRRGAAEEDEDEMLRRAIAESEAMAQAHAAREDAGADVEADENVMEGQAGAQPPAAAPQAPAPAWHQHRVYDDEDEELQAALRASLETVPEGFQVPPSPPPVPAPQVVPQRQPSAAASLQPPPLQRQPSSDMETESEAESTEVPEQEQLSMEEIRRRRLARFGG
ncbi:Josephin-domain-containing protein [Trametes elegans]|nr:Josephin-domain-containing protein [Trametes elegans]